VLPFQKVNKVVCSLWSQRKANPRREVTRCSSLSRRFFFPETLCGHQCGPQWHSAIHISHTIDSLRVRHLLKCNHHCRNDTVQLLNIISLKFCIASRHYCRRQSWTRGTKTKQCPTNCKNVHIKKYRNVKKTPKTEINQIPQSPKFHQSYYNTESYSKTTRSARA